MKTRLGLFTSDTPIDVEQKEPRTGPRFIMAVVMLCISRILSF